MSAYEVRLTDAEIIAAWNVGCFRRYESIKSGLNKNKHAARSDWATDIDGALAETAIAKVLGVYGGRDVNTFKKPDVLSYQVRATSYTNGHLIIRLNDSPDEVYIFCVTAFLPVIKVMGWIRGSDAMVDEFIHEPDSAGVKSWWVPVGRLNAFNPDKSKGEKRGEEQRHRDVQPETGRPASASS